MQNSDGVRDDEGHRLNQSSSRNFEFRGGWQSD